MAIHPRARLALLPTSPRRRREGPMRGSLPRGAGEGWGGGASVAAIHSPSRRAPLPTSPRKRGEERKQESCRCR